jgi:hypothetical protein
MRLAQPRQAAGISERITKSRERNVANGIPSTFAIPSLSPVGAGDDSKEKTQRWNEGGIVFETSGLALCYPLVEAHQGNSFWWV